MVPPPLRRAVRHPLYRCPWASVRPAVLPDWNAGTLPLPFGVVTCAASAFPLPRCFPAAISTSVDEDSEISEAASSRGLASRKPG